MATYTAHSDPCGRVWIEDGDGTKVARFKQSDTKRERAQTLNLAQQMAAGTLALAKLRELVDKLNYERACNTPINRGNTDRALADAMFVAREKVRDDG